MSTGPAELSSEKPAEVPVAAEVELHRFYEQVLLSCAPFQFTGRLAFLAPDGDVYCCPADPAAFWAGLSAEFAADVLIKSGVAASTADEGLALAAVFSDPNGQIIALRDESGRVIELLTECGCLTGRELPVLAVLQDNFTRAAARRERGDLYVAATIADVVALRACGLAATLSTALDHLSSQQVDQFCEVFGFERRKSNRRRDEEMEQQQQQWQRQQPRPAASDEDQSLGDDDDDDDDDEDLTVHSAAADSQPTEAAEEGVRWTLVFVGWSPSQIDPVVPATIASAAEHLRTLEELLGVDFTELAQWNPTSVEIEQLAYYASQQDAGGFREAILDSNYDSSNDFVTAHVDKSSPQPAPPQNFVEALVRIRELARNSPRNRVGASGYQRAQRDFEDCLDKDIIQPIIMEGLAARDPIERAKLVALAECHRLFHQEVTRAEPLGTGSQEQIKNILKMAQSMLALSRASGR